MSTIADNFIKDGSFGRRLLAMLASFYAIALLYGHMFEVPRGSGYSVIASALRSVGLEGPADWFVDTLVAALLSSPFVPFAAVVAAAVAALSMAATFRRTVYNTSPQASFAYLLAVCLLVDLGEISLRTSLIGTMAIAVGVGLFCLIPADDLLEHPAAVALLMFIGPISAIAYGPAKILHWLASEPPAKTVPIAIEYGTGPVKVELVESSLPAGARLR